MAHLLRQRKICRIITPRHDIYRQWCHKLQRTWITWRSMSGTRIFAMTKFDERKMLLLTCVSIISSSLIGSAILDWSFDATVWHIETNRWYNIIKQQDKCHRKLVKCKWNYLTIDELWWYMHWIPSNHNTDYIWCYGLLLSDFQQKLSKWPCVEYNNLFNLQKTNNLRSHHPDAQWYGQ